MAIRYLSEVGPAEILKSSKLSEFEFNDPRLVGISYFLAVAIDSDTDSDIDSDIIGSNQIVGRIVGRIIAGIYPTTTCTRPGQWTFGHNRYRCAWIDRIDVSKAYRGHHIGTQLMQMAEDYFRSVSQLDSLSLPDPENINQSKKTGSGRKRPEKTESSQKWPEEARRNMYILSVHSAVPFYLKNGWTLIDTPEHQEDYDEADVFIDQIGIWCAKPLSGQNLDQEIPYFLEFLPADQLSTRIQYGDPSSEVLQESLYLAWVHKFLTGQNDLDDEDNILSILALSAYVYPLAKVQGIFGLLEKALSEVSRVGDSKSGETANLFLPIQSDILYTTPLYLSSICLRANPHSAEILAWLSNTFQVKID